MSTARTVQVKRNVLVTAEQENMKDQPDFEVLWTTRYRKSSRSSGAQSCVAIGHAAGWTGVQDTKEDADSRQRTTLAVPAQQFAAFVTAVKDGQLSL